MRLRGALGTAAGVALAWFDGPLSPSSFRAWTSKVYAVAFVRRVTVCSVVFSSAPTMFIQLPNEPVPVFCRYSYPVMVFPPSDAGACHRSLTDPSPGVASRFVGAVGTVTGVTASGRLAALCPTLFTARIATTCAMPLTRPVTVWLVVFASLPGMSAYAVISIWFVSSKTQAWYFRIALPLFAGVVHSTLTSPAPGVTVGNTEAGTSTVALAWLEAVLSSLAFTARTSKVKVVGGLLAVRPFTV